MGIHHQVVNTGCDIKKNAAIRELRLFLSVLDIIKTIGTNKLYSVGNTNLKTNRSGAFVRWVK